jgi:hypothetical protein
MSKGELLPSPGDPDAIAAALLVVAKTSTAYGTAYARGMHNSDPEGFAKLWEAYQAAARQMDEAQGRNPTTTPTRLHPLPSPRKALEEKP